MTQKLNICTRLQQNYSVSAALEHHNRGTRRHFELDERPVRGAHHKVGFVVDGDHVEKVNNWLRHGRHRDSLLCVRVRRRKTHLLAHLDTVHAHVHAGRRASFMPQTARVHQHVVDWAETVHFVVFKSEQFMVWSLLSIFIDIKNIESSVLVILNII
jgi:hypothetical protein